MGTFNITSSAINDNFIYNNEVLSINGSFQKDAPTGELQSISGSCYRQTASGPGEFVGNFSGHKRDGEMRYSLSEMLPSDTENVMAAIVEIEQFINEENV